MVLHCWNYTGAARNSDDTLLFVLEKNSNVLCNYVVSVELCSTRENGSVTATEKYDASLQVLFVIT